jgi:hypothetical protein
MEQSIYQERGFQNRKHYLRCMSENYGVPLEVVFMLADLLGESEDFDGLINQLEDYEGDV